MSRILSATLATAFAAACLAGSTVAFAAGGGDNNPGGNIGNDPGGHQTISRNSPDMKERLDYGTTGSTTTCDRKDSIQHASCFKGLPKLK